MAKKKSPAQKPTMLNRPLLRSPVSMNDAEFIAHLQAVVDAEGIKVDFAGRDVFAILHLADPSTMNNDGGLYFRDVDERVRNWAINKRLDRPGGKPKARKPGAPVTHDNPDRIKAVCADWRDKEVKGRRTKAEFATDYEITVTTLNSWLKYTRPGGKYEPPKAD